MGIVENIKKIADFNKNRKQEESKKDLFEKPQETKKFVPTFPELARDEARFDPTTKSFEPTPGHSNTRRRGGGVVVDSTGGRSPVDIIKAPQEVIQPSEPTITKFSQQKPAMQFDATRQTTTVSPKATDIILGTKALEPKKTTIPTYEDLLRTSATERRESGAIRTEKRAEDIFAPTEVPYRVEGDKVVIPKEFEGKLPSNLTEEIKQEGLDIKFSEKKNETYTNRFNVFIGETIVKTPEGGLISLDPSSGVVTETRPAPKDIFTIEVDDLRQATELAKQRGDRIENIERLPSGRVQVTFRTKKDIPLEFQLRSVEDIEAQQLAEMSRLSAEREFETLTEGEKARIRAGILLREFPFGEGIPFAISRVKGDDKEFIIKRIEDVQSQTLGQTVLRDIGSTAFEGLASPIVLGGAGRLGAKVFTSGAKKVLGSELGVTVIRRLETQPVGKFLSTKTGKISTLSVAGGTTGAGVTVASAKIQGEEVTPSDIAVGTGIGIGTALSLPKGITGKIIGGATFTGAEALNVKRLSESGATPTQIAGTVGEDISKAVIVSRGIGQGARDFDEIPEMLRRRLSFEPTPLRSDVTLGERVKTILTRRRKGTIQKPEILRRVKAKQIEETLLGKDENIRFLDIEKEDFASLIDKTVVKPKRIKTLKDIVGEEPEIPEGFKAVDIGGGQLQLQKTVQKQRLKPLQQKVELKVEKAKAVSEPQLQKQELKSVQIQRQRQRLGVVQEQKQKVAKKQTQIQEQRQLQNQRQRLVPFSEQKFSGIQTIDQTQTQTQKPLSTSQLLPLSLKATTQTLKTTSATEETLRTQFPTPTRLQIPRRTERIIRRSIVRRGSRTRTRLMQEQQKKERDRMKKQESFIPQVRVRGKFVDVTDEPLRKRDAERLASQLVDSTSPASFRILRSKEPPSEKRVSGSFERFKFRPSKRQNNVLVEKTKYRIDSRGENKEITQEGLKALARQKLISPKSKSKSRSGVLKGLRRLRF